MGYDKPVCGKCGKVMTPKDSRVHPEYFLHDACLPYELKPQPEPQAVSSHGPTAPKTHEEAQFFHDGFLAGATVYAGAVGHSQLKSDNPKLCEVFDAQGWRTIETFEKLAEAVLVCEHGIADGEWCEPCSQQGNEAGGASGGKPVSDTPSLGTIIRANGHIFITAEKIP